MRSDEATEGENQRARIKASGHRYISAGLALLWTTTLVASAGADGVTDIDKKLDTLTAEVGRMSGSIRQPSEVAKASSPDTVGRRLIDAQVNFSVGNYDDAAIVLYDIVERYPNHVAADEALYYLAESLYQKGDTVAARTYFSRMVTTKPATSKFYRQSLERLIELALLLDDSANVDTWLAALDKVPGAEQNSSVPYVRGKYYYFRKDFDRAIPQFQKVAVTSEYSLQARYFLGVAHTAKGDLGAASQVFQNLTRETGKTAEQKRVIELSHMAIGRLHYERDQPARAIDSYLNISRRSELFADALFEAAWVYVKNKEFNKALRALELLALSDPSSYKLPEVRILEANLRIRRAQSLEGTSLGNPEEEYQKAQQLFESTNSAFKDPHEALKAIAAEKQDPRVFLEQITGRSSGAFETQAVLPDVAAAWLRQEPDVKRVVAVESDLAQIEGEIGEAEQIVTRLERALFSPSRVNIFPSLASKRIRGTEILEEVMTMRGRLAAEARKQMGNIGPADRAELDRLAANRKAVQAKLKTMPDSDASFGERISRAKGAFDAADQERAKVATVVQHTEAQLVAIERYLASGGANITAEEKAEVERGITEMRAEVDAMRAELDGVQRDLTLGRDQAGTGDQAADEERKLRQELRAALDAEAAMITRLAGGGSGARIAAAMQKAGAVATSVDAMFTRIDSIVDAALAEVRTDLNSEKVKLAAYKQEFQNYELESASLGSEVLGGSFDNVAGKFYQILIRTDVGVVDVAWSRTEEADRRERRLTLDQAREMRTIDAEFSDVLREIADEKAKEEAEAAKKAAEEAKATDSGDTTDGATDPPPPGAGGAPSTNQPDAPAPAPAGGN